MTLRMKVTDVNIDRKRGRFFFLNSILVLSLIISLQCCVKITAPPELMVEEMEDVLQRGSCVPVH